MTATFCPDSHEPVSVKAGAREGRCDWCRPQRQHSQSRTPNSRERWDQLLDEHRVRS